MTVLEGRMKRHEWFEAKWQYLRRFGSFAIGGLVVAAIGLFGYAAWRIVQGVLDPERDGRGWKGIAMRVGFVARGVMHAALGWQALRLHRGLSVSGGPGERIVFQGVRPGRSANAKAGLGRTPNSFQPGVA